ncbi:hypothetical protein Syun_009138 [Stephania yunnanensis]|uniref:FCP1 homology domain-containing protein n=1 Tax=Stephania yunnanensis TaxID=152371 RepID=A0AAP0KFT5_9MAGN
MPALKMKTKSRYTCSKERTGLGVGHKSCKISKSSCSEIITSQQAASAETSVHDCQNGSHDILSSRGNYCDEAVSNQDLSIGDNCDSQDEQIYVVDCPCAKMELPESPPATCLPDFETIFSPAFELVEGHCDFDIYTHAAKRDPEAVHFRTDYSDEGSSSLFGYQTCSISDFHFSDKTVAGVYFGGNAGFDNIIEANTFTDQLECADHDLIFGMTDRSMLLPFLEETVETSNVHDGGSCEEATTNSDEACLYLATQPKTSYDLEAEANSHCFDSDEVDNFDPYLFIQNLADLSEVVPSFRPMLSPKETKKMKPITLVLDLDETLVHSTLDHCGEADFSFPVFYNMEEHIVYVKQRPHLKTFLERVAEMFEIVIFTASQSTYAEKLLDILDPEGNLISRRAYRESCIFSEGSYTKDLTVLGIDLAKVAIIDNSPQVFRLQVNNGIPIKSWFDDPSDCALISLLPFLETLVDADDVRPIIAEKFSVNE